MKNFNGSNSSHFYISGHSRIPYVTMRRDDEMGTGWYFNAAAAMEAAHWFAALSRELSKKGKKAKAKRAKTVVKTKKTPAEIKKALEMAEKALHGSAPQALSGAAEPAPNDEIPF